MKNMQLISFSFCFFLLNINLFAMESDDITIDNIFEMVQNADQDDKSIFLNLLINNNILDEEILTKILKSNYTKNVEAELKSDSKNIAKDLKNEEKASLLQELIDRGAINYEKLNDNKAKFLNWTGVMKMSVHAVLNENDSTRADNSSGDEEAFPELVEPKFEQLPEEIAESYQVYIESPDDDSPNIDYLEEPSRSNPRLHDQFGSTKTLTTDTEDLEIYKAALIGSQENRSAKKTAISAQTVRQEKKKDNSENLSVSAIDNPVNTIQAKSEISSIEEFKDKPQVSPISQATNEPQLESPEIAIEIKSTIEPVDPENISEAEVISPAISSENRSTEIAKNNAYASQKAVELIEKLVANAEMAVESKSSVSPDDNSGVSSQKTEIAPETETKKSEKNISENLSQSEVQNSPVTVEVITTELSKESSANSQISPDSIKLVLATLETPAENKSTMASADNPENLSGSYSPTNSAIQKPDLNLIVEMPTKTDKDDAKNSLRVFEDSTKAPIKNPEIPANTKRKDTPADNSVKLGGSSEKNPPIKIEVIKRDNTKIEPTRKAKKIEKATFFGKYKTKLLVLAILSSVAGGTLIYKLLNNKAKPQNS